MKPIYFNKSIGDFSGTSVREVMSKMIYKDNVVIKKGYVPETLNGIDEQFCFVNLDMDLYRPTLEALQYFYPRMVIGGVILLHDFYHPDLKGVEKAVEDFETLIEKKLVKIPAGDSGSVALIKID